MATAENQNEIRVATQKGEVRIRSFCSPAEIKSYAFDEEFVAHAQYKSLYTRRESLETDAIQADANVVLALSPQNHIIGFGVLAYPDAGERWAELGSGTMMEVRVIEVCRSWRLGGIAANILKMAIAHPAIEEKIAYMVGYSWTWDLDKTGLKAQEYRQILIKLFESCDFVEYETNEPNICMKHENLFMCRIGGKIHQETIDSFNWLRFGITPEETSPQVALYSSDTTETEFSRSLFLPLAEEQLTTLGIYCDWKTGAVSFRAMREWDAGVEWHRYKTDFGAEQPLTYRSHSLGHEETRELFQRYALEGYLDEVVDYLKKGSHQAIICYLEKQLGIGFVNYVHSSILGYNHVYQAIRSGGICFADREREEIESIAVGLNLSRAMSFKNASARIPFGGCRISIHSNPIDTSDRNRLGFLAYAIDRSHCFVGPDMGFPPELIDVMKREGYSLQVTGGLDSKVGPPGSPTAFGLYLAIKEAAYSRFGSLSLTGKKIVIQGLGSVGFPLVDQYLIQENAELYLSDISNVPIKKLAAKYPGQFQTLRPESITGFNGDIWVPCAIGSVIDAGNIDELQYAIILGAANNTLKAESQEEEIKLAQLLGRRNILFQIDWLHNTAGIIGGAEEYMKQEAANQSRVLEQVEKVCSEGVRLNLRSAQMNRITPTEQAYRYYNTMIYR